MICVGLLRGLALWPAASGLISLYEENVFQLDQYIAAIDL